MSNILKKIGVAFLAIVITGFVYFILTLDQKSKHDILESSLRVLGDKLLSMVPENDEKKPVETIYNQFLKQVSERQIPPEKVEYVAANIFNLTNFDTIIAPEQVKTLFEYSMNQPEKIEKSDNDSLDRRIQRSLQSNRSHFPPKEHPFSDKDWRQLGEKIQSIHSFNEELDHINVTPRKRGKPGYMHFHVNKDLNIFVDNGIKDRLPHKRPPGLENELQKLEKWNMITWQKDMEKELSKERQQLINELKSLRELKQEEMHQKIEMQKAFDQIKQLEILKQIEINNINFSFKLDSIHTVIDSTLDNINKQTIIIKTELR